MQKGLSKVEQSFSEITRKAETPFSEIIRKDKTPFGMKWIRHVVHVGTSSLPFPSLPLSPFFFTTVGRSIVVGNHEAKLNLLHRMMILLGCESRW